MSSIERLLANYERQVGLPWAKHSAGKQRVWFAVYPPSDERRVRARLPQFEQLTEAAGHEWSLIDLTPLLPKFVSAHKYREAIFKDPSGFRVGVDLEKRAAKLINDACSVGHEGSVVAVIGLATLFDFVRVSSLMEQVEGCISGRLLVFFPGEYSNSVYRFMDARDGFNYMAVAITSTESFLNV